MEPTHFALFPFPEQGHITPIFQLSLHLVSRGAYVTFITTELRGHYRLPSSPENLSQIRNLRFAHISDGLSEYQGSISNDVVVSDHTGHGDRSSSAMPVLLRSLESQSPALEKLLTDLNGAQHWPALSCFVSDAFMPWTAALAQKLQISWIVFWTPSATRLYMTKQATEMDGEKLQHAKNIPGMPLTSTEIFEPLTMQNPQKRQCILSRVESMKKNADVIILNTFDALEEEAIKELASELPIRSIGPLCLGACSEIQASEADEECLSWLDRQAPLSVVYISFGSKALLQGKSLEQLALAIESSKMPFLWVLRSGGKDLPKGFLERTNARSKVMPWVPQERVLGHRAVGAFFTHCGWNSVIEAIVEGVPMICWPIFADQPTNKVLIEEKWRIGRGIEGAEVDAENILQVIQDVMGSEDLRQRAYLLSQSAKSAMVQGGTSYENFSFLVSKGRQSGASC